MGETVKNNKTPITKGFKMNDSDILNDILNTFKHLVCSYATGLNEASNKNLYKLFLDIFTNISKNQAALFDLAFKKGWYQLETADETKIENAYNKFNKLTTELYQTKNTSN